MSTTLTIRQLEPPRRAVIFKNECAPLKGFIEATTTRGDVAYVKGRSEGRARLDGTEEQPVEYEFDFRDRYMSSSSEPFVLEGFDAIQTAQDGGAVLRSMQRDLVTVLVDFRGEEYVGYITDVEVETPTKGEVGRRLITVTIQPTKPAGLNLARRLPLVNDPTDVVQDLRNQWVDFLGRVRVPINAARERIDQAQRAANQINTAISEAIAVVEEARDTVADGVGVAQSTTGALSNLKRGAEAFRQALAVPVPAFVGTDDPEQGIRTMEMMVDAERTMRMLRHTAAIDRRRLDLLDNVDLVGTHVAIAGEDLRLLAYNVYGASDLWVQIAQFNGLTSSELTGGQRVLLPRIDARGVS